MEQSFFRRLIGIYCLLGIVGALLILILGDFLIHHLNITIGNPDAIPGFHLNKHHFLLFLELVFLIVFFLLLPFFVWFYRRVSVPLKSIIEGAREYSRGNLSHTIYVPNASAEIVYLANTMNDMASRLNENGAYQKEMIANISHDLRSPLTIIKGYATALTDGTIPPQMQEHYLNILLRETQRLEKLTLNLLTLDNLSANKRILHMTVFDIQKTLLHCIDSFETTCRKRRIAIDTRFSEASLKVHADQENIQQLLYHLLDNAVKFSENDSRIIVETSAKKETVFVSIRDFGCGIDKDHLPLIWERFYKTDPSRGRDKMGTGLGLPIVKEIIQAHGQTIDVISTPGTGTDVIFTLEKAPRAKQEAFSYELSSHASTKLLSEGALQTPSP
ncbi:MAG: HAMP domain-containing histidine kinase [Blautia sp.]|nr:HAMP domain-containing histidine kinase [Blautia sp.]